MIEVSDEPKRIITFKLIVLTTEVHLISFYIFRVKNNLILVQVSI